MCRPPVRPLCPPGGWPPVQQRGWSVARTPLVDALISQLDDLRVGLEFDIGCALRTDPSQRLEITAAYGKLLTYHMVLLSVFCSRMSVDELNGMVGGGAFDAAPEVTEDELRLLLGPAGAPPSRIWGAKATSHAVMIRDLYLLIRRIANRGWPESGQRLHYPDQVTLTVEEEMVSSAGESSGGYVPIVCLETPRERLLFAICGSDFDLRSTDSIEDVLSPGDEEYGDFGDTCLYYAEEFERSAREIRARVLETGRVTDEDLRSLRVMMALSSDLTSTYLRQGKEEPCPKMVDEIEGVIYAILDVSDNETIEVWALWDGTSRDPFANQIEGRAAWGAFYAAAGASCRVPPPIERPATLKTGNIPEGNYRLQEIQEALGGISIATLRKLRDAAGCLKCPDYNKRNFSAPPEDVIRLCDHIFDKLAERSELVANAQILKKQAESRSKQGRL